MDSEHAPAAGKRALLGGVVGFLVGVPAGLLFAVAALCGSLIALEHWQRALLGSVPALPALLFGSASLVLGCAAALWNCYSRSFAAGFVAAGVFILAGFGLLMTGAL